MNRTLWAGLLGLALNLSASAALYTDAYESGFQNGGVIPDVAVAGSATVISFTPEGGSLASFNGQSPNGTWTRFFADMADVGGTSPSTMGSWSLEIAAVPEPVNMALGGFGAFFALVIIARTQPVRRRIRQWRDAFVHWVDAV